MAPSLSRKAASEETWFDLIRRLPGTRSEGAACTLVAKTLVSMLGLRGVRIFQLSHPQKTLRLAGGSPPRASDRESTLARRAIATGRAANRREAPRRKKARDVTRWLRAVPLRGPQGTWGALVAVYESGRQADTSTRRGIDTGAGLLSERLSHLATRRELERTRNALSAILGQAEEIWFVLDREMRLQFYSERWKRLIGKPHRELQGARLDRLYPGFVDAEVGGRWKELIEKGRTISFREFSFTSPLTGEERIVDADFHAVVDDKGRIIGAVVHVREVGEQRALRRRAEASEDRYRRLFEGIHIPAAVFRMPSGELITWNRQFVKLTGYTDKELASKAVADFVDPRDLPWVLERYRARAEGKDVPEVYQIRAIGAKDRRREAEIYVQPYYEDGELVGTLVAMLDVTDRNLAQQELLSRNRQLAALNRIAETVSQTLDFNEILMESLSCVVDLVTAQSGAIYLESPTGDALELVASLRMPGGVQELARKVKAGQRWMAGKGNRQRPVLISNHQAILKKGHADLGPSLPRGPLVRVELRSRGKMLGVLLLLYPEGREISEKEQDLLKSIGGQVGVAIENARLYAEVKEANERLRQLDEKKDEFISTVSHEIKAPLTSIQGSTDLMLTGKEGPITPEQRRFLTLIRRSTERLDRLTRDLLDLSRIESGFHEPAPQRTSLQALIRDVIEQMEPLALEKGLTLEIRHVDRLPRVSLVVDRIRQVLTNLVSNAIRFTPEGGQVWVEARRRKEEAIVTVADTGIGIPREHHERIFEQFLQFGPPEVRQGGTGLGLTISRKIVESHGGRIWLESEPGAGSRFFFALPLRKPARPSAKS